MCTKLEKKTYSLNQSIFHRLEVVGRASETQLQVGENIHFIM